MKVGIIQSNYIPWRGYFDLMDDVDLFVFYDDVQYTGRDWRNRNRIKTSQGASWLSVPVRHGRDTLIQDAEIDYNSRWVNKHVRTLTLAYEKAPFFEYYAQTFFDVLSRRYRTISELNIALCKSVMEKLEIDTKVLTSAEFDIDGSKYDRPLAILQHLGATSYLSGPAANSYIDADRYAAANIAVELKSYEYSTYPQLHGSFTPNLTILDLLFNCGDDSRDFLKSSGQNEKQA